MSQTRITGYSETYLLPLGRLGVLFIFISFLVPLVYLASNWPPSTKALFTLQYALGSLFTIGCICLFIGRAYRLNLTIDGAPDVGKSVLEALTEFGKAK